MKIQKSFGLFRLDNPNKLIEVLPIRQNIVYLCEQDKTIDTFFYTKRVEVDLSQLPEYNIAFNKTTTINKKALMNKVIDILNKFNNDKNIQKYLVV
jgi:hypothetical protein